MKKCRLNVRSDVNVSDRELNITYFDHIDSSCSVFSQNYIARFGHGSAKLARQAQSKEKTLKKMVDGGLTERVGRDKVGLFSQRERERKRYREIEISKIMSF